VTIKPKDDESYQVS